MSGRQEHEARWLATVQAALGPHGEAAHGLVQVLLRHDSLAEQSPSEWQAKMQRLARQMWPRKQSLSTRQVTVV